MRVALVEGAGLTFETAIEPPDVDRLLREALRRRGAETAQIDWHASATDLTGFDAAVVRTCWDYTGDVAGFLTWAAAAATQTRLINRPETLRWSCDKSYLIELSRAGVPTVPTVLVSPARIAEAIAAVAGTHKSRKVIVKPAVGVGADRVTLLDTTRSRDAAMAAHDTIRAAAGKGGGREDLIVVQPYRESIVEGEISVVILGGEISHATRKTPAPGEYRVQSIYGGTYTSQSLSGGSFEQVSELALAAYRQVPGAPEVCRVDIMQHNGAHEVSEVEAIEPDLYLETAPDAAERLADIILAAAEAHRETDGPDAPRQEAAEGGPAR